MANLDEIFAAIPAAAAEADREYLVIDPVTRTITVPESERIFGVTGDELADRKYFMCPRYVGDGLDLAGMFIRVNYRNAGGDEDGYLVEDVAVVGDYVTFSWRLWPKVTEYMGAIQFGVCADLPNTTERRFPDWNTTMASGEVLEGLHPYDGAVEEETRDVVTQLRAETAAQTAAVEACGAEQVQAVQDAATAATAAAEAQVAAKGAATLATIPADYTTLANKTNEQANAIKGHLAGEIVQAGDVSPVEHYLGVKVHGKNLFDATKIPTATPSVSYAYICEVGAGHIVVRTEEGYDGNGYCTVAKTLREVCPALEIGKTYVMTADTESNSTNMYLPGIQKSWIFGRAMVMTEAVLNSAMTFYGLSAREGKGTGDCTISNIQIEEGTEATEYTPYIDPAGVTVTRCGKNLLPYPYNGTVYSNGVTFTDNGNGSVTLNGKNNGESNSVFYITKDTYTALAKGRYTGSLGADGVTLLGVLKGGGYKTLSAGFNLAESIELRSVYIQIAKGSAVSFDNVTVYPQLEHGEAATAYEAYNGVTTMPAADGTVTGLPSLAPTMTLLADTAGVTIDCTYNRDSNAVYAELLAKIAALSGNN